MSLLKDLLSVCADHFTAPAESFGFSSPVSCEPYSGLDSSSQSGVDWHNNFGTAADYQVPAEAFNDFQSWDWTGGHGMGGFD